MATSPGNPRCGRCNGRGGTITANGWTKCACTRVTNPQARYQALCAYYSCSRRYKDGETGWENISLAIRRCLGTGIDIDRMVKVGVLSRKEIQDIQSGQQALV